MTYDKELKKLAALMTPEGRIDRLMELYDSAKEANGGASMTIYQDVTDLIDRLEDAEFGEDIDADFDALCGRLRGMGGDVS